MTDRPTRSTSPAASVIDGAGRPPRPPPGPPRPAPAPSGPPLPAAPVAPVRPAPRSAAAAPCGSSPQPVATIATAPTRRAPARARRPLGLTRTRITGRGRRASRPWAGRWQRDRPAERARQLCTREVQIVRRPRLVRLRRQQRELRVGDLELRAQSACEAQRREIERLARFGRSLLLRLKESAHTAKLRARTRDLDRHRLARLLQLELGQ